MGAAAQTLRPQYSISLANLLEASVTVFLTTLDDCVWLIPFVAQAPSASIALSHGFVFITTLVGVSVATSALAVLFDDLVKTDSLLILEATGAAICWVLAGFFFYRSYVKRKRRRRETFSFRQPPSSVFIPLKADTVCLTSEYGAVLTTTGDNHFARLGSSLTGPTGDDDVEGDAATNNYQLDLGNGQHLQTSGTQAAHAQPWVIISLTVLGSLDEVSYFPALIVGQIFTAAEVVAGTLIATLLILGLIDVLTRHCEFCMYFLDQVPLYAVISIFAFVLSLKVLVDLAA